ncbi:MAG: threonine synthase [Candidatus Micrarchaeia archaeon]
MFSLFPLYELKCVLCGSSFSEEQTYTRCLKCGGPLDVKYDYRLVERRLDRGMLKSAPLKNAKYRAFYPIEGELVTLDEGGTPLYECRNFARETGIPLLVKNEGANPTGAFKDRGTAVEITKAVEHGAKAVACASTGNMAASVAAYAAKVGLPCHVLVPDGTAMGKLAQVLSYGARLLQIKGTYADAFELAARMAKKFGFWLMGDYAFRVEGQKSQAYEIIEQLGWKSPDYVVVPIGVGTNIAAIWKGFKEFKEFGLTDKLPQLIGVQAKGCNPIVRAFRKKGKVEPEEHPDTIATAIMAGNPYDAPKALAALRESKGMAVDVSDDDIIEAQQLLARTESIFVEPSAACGVAAVLKLKDKLAGKLGVCVLTGNGLKDPLTALKGFTLPPSVEPNIKEIEKYINNRLYNLKAPLRREEKNKVVFRDVPSERKVLEAVRANFNISIERERISEVREAIGEFIGKGKPVTRADLKSILEGVFTKIPPKRRVLVVEDYLVTASARAKPRCVATLSFEGKRYSEEGEGDGPVDATINAIKKALAGKGVEFALTDYGVTISTGGTEATVEVSMSLKDRKGNKAVGLGASPDIVLASIRAFEAAYNTLYWKNKEE